MIGLKRVAAAAAAVAATATLALAAPAGAATTAGNDNAYVVGVQGVPAWGQGADCNAGNVCLYTGSVYSGTRFDLYYYQRYSLGQWNGVGSWYNNQTGNAYMKITDQNGSTLRASYAGGWDSSYDFNPAWYVTLCPSAC